MGALSVALTRREERLDTDAEFAITSRNTNAIVGVYQLQDGPNALQANLRRDDSSQFGGQTSGSFAYAYTITPGLRASASYGTGFRAPTFNDLYFPGFSNPNLVPGDRAQLRGRVALCKRRNQCGHRRVQEPRAQSHRVRVRRRFQLRAAERRRRHAGRHHARVAGADPRHHGEGKRRFRAALRRCDGQSAPASRAPLRLARRDAGVRAAAGRRASSPHRRRATTMRRIRGAWAATRSST